MYTRPHPTMFVADEATLSIDDDIRRSTRGIAESRCVCRKVDTDRLEEIEAAGHEVEAYTSWGPTDGLRHEAEARAQEDEAAESIEIALYKYSDDFADAVCVEVLEIEGDDYDFEGEEEPTEIDVEARLAEIRYYNRITGRNVAAFSKAARNGLIPPVVIRRDQCSTGCRLALKPPATIVVPVVIAATPVVEQVKPPVWERVDGMVQAIVALLEERGFHFGLVKPKTVADLRRRIESSPKWGNGPMELIEQLAAK